MSFFDLDLPFSGKKDLSLSAEGIGLRKREEWVEAAMRCPWLPDAFIAGIGDGCRLVSGPVAIGAELLHSFRQCSRELHVCTHDPYLLTELSRARQLLSSFSRKPHLFLYTKNDSVVRAGFALSDILAVTDIRKTRFEGHFVLFDDRSALVFLGDTPASAQEVLAVESVFGVNMLKALATTP